MHEELKLWSLLLPEYLYLHVYVQGTSILALVISIIIIIYIELVHSIAAAIMFLHT